MRRLGDGSRGSARVLLILLLILLTGVVFLPPAANASRAGDLDPTFGRQGRVLEPQNARALALTRAGDKLIAAGCFVLVPGGACKQTALARYRSDGTLDPSFDGDGLARFDFNPDDGPVEGGAEGATAVAVDGSGKIVIAGQIRGQFALARFGQDGSIDPTFGSGQGIVFGPAGSARALTFYGDKWILAGVSNGSFTIARYDGSTGAPDTTFDGDGSKEISVPGNNDGALGVVADESGIYAVGYANVAGPGGPVEDFLGNDPQRRVAVVRLDHDGELNIDFDDDGVFTGDPGTFTSAVRQTSTGKVVAAGRIGNRFALMRFGEDGADTDFGEEGKALGPAGRAAALVESGTRLIAAGRNIEDDMASPIDIPAYGGADMVLTRFTDEGAVDTAFGSNGFVVTDMGGGTDEAIAAVMHPLPQGNRIAVAGFSGQSSTWRFALARYLAESGTENVRLKLGMKAPPGPLELGDNLVYDMTISNESASIAYGVRFEQELPTGPDFVSYSSQDGVCRIERITGGESRPTRLVCDLVGIQAGGSNRIQVIVAPNAPGIVRSSALISTTSNDDSSDNSATATTTVVPHEGVYNPILPMAGPRAGHRAVLLDGDGCRMVPPPGWCGDVLVVGGRSDPNDRSTELYDPGTNTWRNGPTLNSYHGLSPSASVLKNGSVLVVGSPEPDRTPDAAIISTPAEIWDPARGEAATFEQIESPAIPRPGHAAVTLRDGRVLIVGGFGRGPSSGIECADRPGEIQRGASVKRAEIFDPQAPAGSRFKTVAPMLTGRHGLVSKPGSSGGGGGFTATLLPDGKVLVVGGHKGLPWDSASPDGRRPDACDGRGPLAPGEVYDPKSDTWYDTGGPQIARQSHTATLLQNGKILIAGGNTTIGDVFSTAHAAIFDPQDTSSGRLGTWNNTASLMINDRVNHAAALLENGKVLITGGLSKGAVGERRHPRGAELYDPLTNKFVPGGVTVTRRDHTATALGPGPLAGCSFNCGKILLAGGHSTEGQSLPDPANPVLDLSDPFSLLGPQNAVPVASADLYTSPPSIDRLDPPEGPLAGSTEVVISGAALANTTKVTFDGQLPLVCGNKAVARCWVDEELPDRKLHVMTPSRSAPGVVGLTVETLPGMTASSVFRYLGDALPPGPGPPGASGSGGNNDGGGGRPPPAPPSGSAGSTQPATNLNNSQLLTGPPSGVAPQLVSSEAVPLGYQSAATFQQIVQQAGPSAAAVLSLQAQAAYAPAASEAEEREPQPAPRYMFAVREETIATAVSGSAAGVSLLLACFVIAASRKNRHEGRAAVAAASARVRSSPRAAI